VELYSIGGQAVQNFLHAFVTDLLFPMIRFSDPRSSAKICRRSKFCLPDHGDDGDHARSRR
jgi:hypothetical protein